jgi:site-specific recombinase XerD
MAPVQKFKQLQWVIVGLEIYTQDFAYCENFAPEPPGSSSLFTHLFRHQMITYLTTKELSGSQVQLISEHESKKSLEVYQHLSLKNVEQAYQEAVKSIEV